MLNKTSKLIIGGGSISAIAVLLVFSISFTPVSLETQSLSPQQIVDLELEQRGMVNIDGVWFTPDYLDFQKLAKQMINEGKSVPLQIGGIATVIHKDINGNPITVQKIHNRVVDSGEDFIIDQVFKEGTAGETADADQIASICVTAEAAFVDTSETMTASTFDTNDNLSAQNNCIADASVTQSAQTAVIGALTFDAPTHVPAATTITGIGICQGSASTPFSQCADAQAASGGILFSIINIADVTLQTSETVDITYTLDISSAGS